MFGVHSGKDADFDTLVVVGNSRYFIVYRITAEQNTFRIPDMTDNGQNGFRLQVNYPAPDRQKDDSSSTRQDRFYIVSYCDYTREEGA
jgi:hypothetical protein